MSPGSCRAERLRERFRRHEPVFGAHVFLGDPQITEAFGLHGYEFVWIDGEHSPFGNAAILAHVQAAAAGGTASLVRVPWNDPVLVKPVLEMGPDGVILPLVASGDEARRAVAACRYPPAGVRGFGPRRAIRYGAEDLGEYFESVDRSFLVIVQIEHVRAVERLEEIVAVPGVDLAVVGPNDLAASAGCLGRTKCPEMSRLYDRIAEGCARAGAPFGVSIGAGDFESMTEWVGRGAVFIGCGDDVAFISAGSRATMDFVRGHFKRTP